MRRLAGWAACAALGAGTMVPAAAQNVPDLVAHDTLRVCADPHLLPFSNDRGEGFENHIATRLAKALGEALTYVWYPESSGFLRNTLGAQRCDVVMGLPSGGGEATTTPAYYHTGYVVVTRAADHIAATSLSDPVFATLRLGVIAGTPPSDLLLAHDLMGQATIYQLVVDTRHDSPSLAMMDDVASGRIDAGLVWGPYAGWAVTHEGLKLHIAFLQAEPGHPRLDYTIGMGVRPNETQWARQLAAVASAQKAEIEHDLIEAGVPLLDSRNQPLFMPGTKAE